MNIAWANQHVVLIGMLGMVIEGASRNFMQNIVCNGIRSEIYVKKCASTELSGITSCFQNRKNCIKIKAECIRHFAICIIRRQYVRKELHCLSR